MRWIHAFPEKSIKPPLFFWMRRSRWPHRLKKIPTGDLRENNYSEIKDLGAEAVVQVISGPGRALSSVSGSGFFAQESGI